MLCWRYLTCVWASCDVVLIVSVLCSRELWFWMNPEYSVCGFSLLMAFIFVFFTSRVRVVSVRRRQIPNCNRTRPLIGVAVLAEGILGHHVPFLFHNWGRTVSAQSTCVEWCLNRWLLYWRSSPIVNVLELTRGVPLVPFLCFCLLTPLDWPLGVLPGFWSVECAVSHTSRWRQRWRIVFHYLKWLFRDTRFVEILRLWGMRSPPL